MELWYIVLSDPTRPTVVFILCSESDPVIFVCCLLPQSVLHQWKTFYKDFRSKFIVVLSISKRNSLFIFMYNILHHNLLLIGRLSIGVMSIRCFILVLRTPYCGYINLNRSYKDWAGFRRRCFFVLLICSVIIHQNSLNNLFKAQRESKDININNLFII